MRRSKAAWTRTQLSGLAASIASAIVALFMLAGVRNIAAAQAAPPQLTAVVSAIEAHDVAALAGRIQFAPRACAPKTSDIGPPVCPAGVAAGTAVDSFYLSFCDQRYTTGREAVDAALALAFPAGARSSVYAIFGGGAPDVTNTPEPGFAIIAPSGAIAQPATQAVVVYTDPVGAITGLEFPCGQTTAAAVAAGFNAREVIVAPGAAAPLPLTGWGQGHEGRAYAALVLLGLGLLALACGARLRTEECR